MLHPNKFYFDTQRIKAEFSYFLRGLCKNSHTLQPKKLKPGMKKIPILIAAIIWFVSCSPSEKRLETEAHTIPAIDSLISRAIDQNHIPGAVIRVQRADSLLHRKAYGYAQRYDMKLNVIDQPEKMTPEHLFDLASLTKVCATTFGIMMLVDRGEIQLDDPIHKWLPEFENGDKKEITIHHLLSHSAGLYQWKPTYYYARNKEEQYDYISNLPLAWPVGEGRHYSDLGFMLLDNIIEIVSGQTPDNFLQRELYKPLNLQHTTFNPLEKEFTKIAATSHGNPFEKHMVYDRSFGYEVEVDPESWDGWRDYTLRGEVNDGNAWYASRGAAGHAGLFSNVDDLQKLLTLLLDKGAYREKQLISSAVIDTFLTKNRYGNGLGWAMDPNVISTQSAPDGTFGHTGFTGTNIVAMPALDLSIILLTNRQHVGLQEDGYYYNLSALRQQIVDAVLDLEYNR